MFFTSTLALSPYLVLDVDGNNNGIYNEPSDLNLFEGGNADDNQVIIRATVYNKFGERAAGSAVTFSADSTEATFPNGNIETTDLNGQAFVLVEVTPMTDQRPPDSSEYHRIRRQRGCQSCFPLPPACNGNKHDVTANPSVIPPSTQDKESTSTISASVKMLNALPVPDGSVVSFIASCGTVTPFAQTTNGVATATFTAPAIVPSDPCQVTASIAGVSGSADITVTPALSVLPTTQTINGLIGGTVSYTISGGVAPYTVTSGNSATQPATARIDDCSDPEDSGTWMSTLRMPAGITALR